MSSANVDAMVREAKRAIRAGNKSEAQTLLLKATELDQSNEQAWMWLSAVVETVEDQMICLENVLQINPSNADAKRGLELLRKKAPPPSIEKPPSKPNNPFLIEGAEWEIDGNTDFLLDALSPSSPKSSKTPTPPPSSSPRDLLGDDDPINPPTDPFASVFEAADVFKTAYEDDEPESPESEVLDRLSKSEPKKPVTSSPLEVRPKPANDFDDITSLDDDIFGDSKVVAPDDEVDEFLSDFDAPVPQKTKSSASKQPKSAPKPEPDGMSVGADEDPSVYFEMIPADIKPTRIPGVDEEYPPTLIPSIIGLVVLNIGAVLALFLLN
ncbi:MAG: hypothetical protein MUE54_08775 [Anaerolineae bacterium]|jgi:hypothetical protein|nr:hypothetical protein [Anaerolineae bacterium]